MGRSQSRRHGKEDPTRAEHVTLGISVLLLVVLVGGLVLLDVRRGDARPRISAKPHFDAAYEHEGNWYLPVTITNDGDHATGSIRVDLVRPVPGDVPEVAELQFAFVASGDEVKGLAAFDEQPTEDTIEVDVVSVTEPP